MPGVLEVNTDFPIRTGQPVHFGKVRAVYWLTKADSARLIKDKGYDVAPDTDLAVMVISDRISAFDCIWKGEDGLNGVPGKVWCTVEQSLVSPYRCWTRLPSLACLCMLSTQLLPICTVSHNAAV